MPSKSTKPKSTKPKSTSRSKLNAVRVIQSHARSRQRKTRAQSKSKSHPPTKLINLPSEIQNYLPLSLRGKRSLSLVSRPHHTNLANVVLEKTYAKMYNVPVSALTQSFIQGLYNHYKTRVKTLLNKEKRLVNAGYALPKEEKQYATYSNRYKTHLQKKVTLRSLNAMRRLEHELVRYPNRKRSYLD